MNSITKISTAVVLGLSLMGMNLAAEAASAQPAVKAARSQGSGVSHASGKVIHLGTIEVTPADVAGTHAAKPGYGTAYLGTIRVTPSDSSDVRYAVSAAQQSGAVYLGTVQVKAHNGKLPVIGSLLAMADSTGSRSLLTMVGALVFGRTGG
ncbi:MAG TPA: hypothetical protein VGN70_06510 [Gammaproteobacteria bacterium]|jgi:hypothetical protein